MFVFSEIFLPENIPESALLTTVTQEVQTASKLLNESASVFVCLRVSETGL